MRHAPVLLSLAALLIAAGCGGGGAPSAGLQEGKAVLGGGVTAVDGAAANLGGIALVLESTGERIQTRSDGSFSFASRVLGDVVVALDGGSDDDGTDDRGSGNEDDDSVERDGTHVEIHDCSEGERIDLRLRIRDGRLEQVDVARGRSSSGSDEQERELEIDMRQGPDADDRDMSGEVELEIEARGEEFEVEVEHADPGRSLRVVVIDTAGAEDDLGVLEVDAFGEAEWKRDTKDGQRLPFGVDSVVDLLGFTVQVRDAVTGAVLLTVELPAMPTLPADDDDDSADDDSDDDSDDDDSDDDDSDDDDSDDDSSDDD